jgi:hypothetical protein
MHRFLKSKISAIKHGSLSCKIKHGVYEQNIQLITDEKKAYGAALKAQSSVHFWLYRASKLLFPNGKMSTANILSLLLALETPISHRQTK